MMQTENDLDKAQEDLSTANNSLEEKDKKVQEVSLFWNTPRKSSALSVTTAEWQQIIGEEIIQFWPTLNEEWTTWKGEKKRRNKKVSIIYYY